MAPQYTKHDSGLDNNHRAFGRYDDTNLDKMKDIFDNSNDNHGSKLSYIQVDYGIHVAYALGL
jgi:hypothetical protein